MLSYGAFTSLQYPAPSAVETLLLDDYPGAQMAYSIRKLSSTYTGNCLRVQRNSDNTELDIGFDSNGYIDTSALTTFLGVSTVGYVAKWYDQSGNSNDIAQTNNVRQPRIYDSGDVTSGGKLAIKFDDDFLTHNNTINIDNTDTSYFFVNEPLSSPASQDGGILQFQEYDGSQWHVNSIGFRDGGYFTRLNPGGFNFSLNGFDTTSTSQNLVTDIIDYNAQTNVFNYNGAAKTDVNAARSNTGAGDTATIGRTADQSIGLPADFKLQELIFYNSNQTTNVTGIQDNINTYYTLY